MGTRNTPEQQREYNRAAEARRRKAGYRRRTIIVHKADWPAVKRLSDELRQKREDLTT
jgi:hypothetical protein